MQYQCCLGGGLAKAFIKLGICASTADDCVSRHCRLDSRLEVLDMPARPAVKVLYGGMRKFKQVSFLLLDVPLLQAVGMPEGTWLAA